MGKLTKRKFNNLTEYYNAMSDPHQPFPRISRFEHCRLHIKHRIWWWSYNWRRNRWRGRIRATITHIKVLLYNKDWKRFVAQMKKIR